MEENDQKPRNHIMSPHAIYFYLKMAKTAKTRIFPDTTLPFDDPKHLSPDFDQVLDKSDERFQRKCPKNLIFEQKWPNFRPNKSND